MTRNTRKKRPTVAFCLSELEGEYSHLLCRGVIEGAESHDFNLLIFPGKTFNSPYRYQYQFNVIYDLISRENADALILPMSVFHTFTTREEISGIYRRYFPLPVVSITIPVEGAAGILLDNKKGLFQVFNHLIREHGRKRIAFIQGTPNNIDAEERYHAYLEALKANNLPFDAALVCPGDFTVAAAEEAVRLLLDTRKVQFDALVAANDDMALSALALLRRRGIRVPEDVSVAGFDDIEASWFSRPALTTVRQPLYEMGRKAVDLAADLIYQGRISTVVMETEAIIRNSCGCKQQAVGIGPRLYAQPEEAAVQAADRIKKRFAQNKTLLHFLEKALPALLNPGSLTRARACADASLLDLFRAVFEEGFTEIDSLSLQQLLARLWEAVSVQCRDKVEIKKTGEFFLNLNMILLEGALQKSVKIRREHDLSFRNLRGILDIMVPYIDQKEAAVAAAVPRLQELGIEQFQIYLYEDEIYCPDYRNWTAPETVRLVAACPQEGMEQVLKENPPLPLYKILTDEYLFSDHRYTMVVNPLFFLDYQMGLIICAFRPENRSLYEHLFIEMGCVLKFTYLIKAKEKIETRLLDALQELRKKNKQLSAISQTDELTGLCNRRGFLHCVRQILQTESSARGLLFYADLDELKAINDTYGHEEGDYALRQAGNILKKTFRNQDIIARWGGDEFTIFTLDTSPGNLQGFQKRLQKQVEEYNRKTKKPYKISICMGAVPFSSNGQKTIEQIMAEADHRLYEQKRAKRDR